MKIQLIGATQSLLPNTDERHDSPYEFCAKTMATCVTNEPFEKMTNESLEDTQKRVISTLKLRHQSGYDMIDLVLLFTDTSKIFITYLHNLHTYSSEGTSGRHVELKLTPKEKGVYDYFYEKFYNYAQEKYPDKSEYFKSTLACETARYTIGIDAKTNLVHKISLRHLNHIYFWAQDFLNKTEYNEFEKLALPDMQEFVNIMDNFTLDGEKVINPKLRDSYDRKFELFNDGKTQPEYFYDTYGINYKATLPTFDQLQRSRPIHYSLSIPSEPEYYIPSLVKEMEIEDEWISKIESTGKISQDLLLNVRENGYLGEFIMKMKERCCEHAQEEACSITKESADKIFKGIATYDAELSKYLMENYGNGKNRREFPNYKCICKQPCTPRKIDEIQR